MSCTTSFSDFSSACSSTLQITYPTGYVGSIDNSTRQCCFSYNDDVFKLHAMLLIQKTLSDSEVDTVIQAMGDPDATSVAVEQPEEPEASTEPD